MRTVDSITIIVYSSKFNPELIIARIWRWFKLKRSNTQINWYNLRYSTAVYIWLSIFFALKRIYNWITLWVISGECCRELLNKWIYLSLVVYSLLISLICIYLWIFTIKVKLHHKTDTFYILIMYSEICLKVNYLFQADIIYISCENTKD